jgi:hypothetical protein
VFRMVQTRTASTEILHKGAFKLYLTASSKVFNMLRFIIILPLDGMCFVVWKGLSLYTSSSVMNTNSRRDLYNRIINPVSCLSTDV